MPKSAFKNVKVPRRAVIAAGLGGFAALALAPAAVLASTFSPRLDDGKAFDESFTGLATIDGDTYLYEAGVMNRDGKVEYQGSRWFDPENGKMAVDKDVIWPDGTTHHYGADGLLADPAPPTGPTLPDGWYTFENKSGYCLDVFGTTGEKGANLQVLGTSGSSTQAFLVVNRGDDVVELLTAFGYAIDLQDGSSEPDANVHQWEVNHAPAQRWQVIREGERLSFTSVAAGTILAAENDSDGANVAALAPEYRDREPWIAHATRMPAGWYVLESALGGRLEIDGVSAIQGARTHIRDASDSPAQRLHVTWDNNAISINSIAAAMLDVEDASTRSGAPVRLWQDNGSSAQRWIPINADDGYLTLMGLGSGNLLTAATGNDGVITASAVDGSLGQKWRLLPVPRPVGWFESNGMQHCLDPTTGLLITSCSCLLDPYLPDPAQWGSLYDFDEAGHASWHLPTIADLTSGTGPEAPLPHLSGDRRQRVIQLALSRLGCPYEMGQAPAGFVCDGLTAWSFTSVTGEWFNPQSEDAQYQDAGAQWTFVRDRNGIKHDRDQLRAGDIVFFGDPSVSTGFIDYDQDYHAGIYYHNDLMINARAAGTLICGVSDYFMDWLGGGSPYAEETNRCEVQE